MTLLNPHWLWLLVAPLVVLALEWRAAARTRRTLETLAGKKADSALLEQRRPGQRRVGWALRAAALAMLAIGAAGPEWGHELVRRSATGSDVMFLVDVSASMDVRDVAPSRLEEARREALAVLERLGGSKVGVVAFAGDAVRLCPLTLDLGAARMTLESLGSGSVSQPGSDLGRGLRMAARALPGGRRSEQVVVVWTDGEDLEVQASAAADELARAGVRVFAVGVGTAGGDVVPVLDDGGRTVDIKRDESGAAVRSRLDERGLRAVARRTRGGYFSAARPGGELPRLLSALGGVSRGARGQHLVERAVPRFPWFATLAALLLAVELARSHRRGEQAARRRRGAGPGARAAAAWIVVLAGAGWMPRPALAQSDWARGDRAMREGRWAQAESLYARRARRGAPAAVRVNLATARARAGKQEQAERELGELSAQPGPTGTVAGYNQGTLLGERGEYDDALRALRRVLEREPGNEDARYNYELALERKRRPPQSPPQPQPRQPSPQGSSGSSGGAGGEPRPQSPQSGASQNPPPPPPPRQGQGLTRQQAEQLLGSLDELERLEQQRLNRTRVTRERKGKDW
jgi:Ca-activated chloride channel family protein